MRTLLALTAFLLLPLPWLAPAAAVADDTLLLMEDGGAVGPGNGGADCGCRDVRRPPWHGNVHGAACGPVNTGGCGGVFHASPCGQLHLRRYAREHCMTLPPCFPRLHGLFADGSMPTPPPPALPRCHQCGAVIEGGF